LHNDDPYNKTNQLLRAERNDIYALNYPYTVSPIQQLRKGNEWKSGAKRLIYMIYHLHIVVKLWDRFDFEMQSNKRKNKAFQILNQIVINAKSFRIITFLYIEQRTYFRRLKETQNKLTQYPGQ